MDKKRKKRYIRDRPDKKETEYAKDRRDKRERVLKRQTGQIKRKNTQETDGTTQEKEYSRDRRDKPRERILKKRAGERETGKIRQA